MFKLVVCVVALFLGAANCYPAQNGEDDIPTEYAFVPLGGQDGGFPDQPVVDTPAYFPYFENPFGGLFGNLENVLTRMRQQLNILLNRLPNTSDSFNTTGISSFGDLGKGNTTSVTKIIDGHTVVINETEYAKNGPNGETYVKIGIIDVRPKSPEGGEEDITTPAINKDVGPVEDSIENEIYKTNEAGNFDNIETFDDVISFPTANHKWSETENFEEFKPNQPFEPFRDLSNDIDVNKYMADAGVPPDPDAELIDAVEAELAFKKLNSRKFEKSVLPRL